MSGLATLAPPPQLQQTFASQRTGRTYIFLLVIRIICAFGPGYVHPDEWFQYGEVLVGDLFDKDTLRTWEFEPSFPCRSMASIRLWGLPLVGLARFYGRTCTPSATILFIVQRLTFLLLSLVVDASLLSVLQRHSPIVRRTALFHFAGSGALLGLGLRPFSNNAELAVFSVVLALERSLSRMSLRQVALGKESGKMSDGGTMRWHAVSALLGASVAIGLFTRFTLAIFAAPIGISYVSLCAERASLNSRYPLTFLRRAIGAASQMRFAFLVFAAVSIAHIVFDSWYYASRAQHDIGVYQAVRQAVTIAPLNAIRYNGRNENLAQHGLHPRWLHVIVNAPMVMGIASWAGVLLDAMRRVCGKTSGARCDVLNLSMAIIFAAIAILSVQPHQEPRFLQPLLLPASLHYGVTRGNALSQGSPRRRGRRWRMILRMLGIAQPAAMTLLFVFLHQAGTIPAMLRWRSWQLPESDLVFWRSFMPPRHLVLQTSPAARVLDLRSSTVEQLTDALGPRNTQSIVLFAPMWAVTGLRRNKEDGALLAPWLRNLSALSVEHRIFPHVDMDHLPECVEAWRDGASLVESFSYGVWLVQKE